MRSDWTVDWTKNGKVNQNPPKIKLMCPTDVWMTSTVFSVSLGLAPLLHLPMNPTVAQQGVHPLLPGLGYRAFTACHLRLRTCQPAFWNAAPTRWGSHSPDLRCLTSSERRGCLSQSRPLHSQTLAGSHREVQLGRCQLPSGSKRGANITYCHFTNLYVEGRERKHWERERVMQQVLQHLQKPWQIHKVQSLC